MKLTPSSTNNQTGIPPEKGEEKEKKNGRPKIRISRKQINKENVGLIHLDRNKLKLFLFFLEIDVERGIFLLNHLLTVGSNGINCEIYFYFLFSCRLLDHCKDIAGYYVSGYSVYEHYLRAENMIHLITCVHKSFFFVDLYSTSFSLLIARIKIGKMDRIGITGNAIGENYLQINKKRSVERE